MLEYSPLQLYLFFSPKDRVCYVALGCPGTPAELRDLPASCLLSAGIKVYATTAWQLFTILFCLLRPFQPEETFYSIYIFLLCYCILCNICYL